LQVQGMVAEYERAKILERSRRGKLHAAREGSVNVLSCWSRSEREPLSRRALGRLGARRRDRRRLALGPRHGRAPPQKPDDP
jgi:DNA invertase Pin-like site-specific DNA recombinase